MRSLTIVQEQLCVQDRFVLINVVGHTIRETLRRRHATHVVQRSLSVAGVVVRLVQNRGALPSLLIFLRILNKLFICTPHGLMD